ncbi:DEAD/DEAH box helicase [Peribacillus frigoritolerans]|uniref:DEAD/DEAH box helicase n=1 Tax=Peribacillus frigoritolerans TaxID=450367 RepID=UPI003D088CE5
MDNMLLKEKLINILQDSVTEKSNLPNLIVFVGFSPEPLLSIQNEKLLNFPYPTSLNNFKFDPVIMGTVMSKMTEKKPFYWATMEEYQFFLRKQLDSFFSIKFVYNNLYNHLFPISYTFNDLETLIEDYEHDDEDVRSEDFENITTFYSDLKKIDQIYGAYTIDEDTLSQWIPYYKTEKQLQLIDRQLDSYDIVHEISEDESQFILLVNRLMENTEPTTTQIIHSNDFSAYTNKYLDRLTVLSLIKPNLSYSFTKHSLTQRKFNEGEYLKYLDKYWGFKSFREMEMYKDPDTSKELIKVKQSQIIHDIVEEVENAHLGRPFRDVFITSSTGAGKSVMFQLPAFMMFEKYEFLTIVISPLIGLMKDQVANLESKGINHVATINSNITPADKLDIQERIKNKELSILYISPETLLNRSDIKNLIGEDTKVGLFIVDEAHIVTTWGKAFRSDYWYLGTYLQKLRKEMPFPIATFTATAIYGGEEDMYKETRDSLGLIHPKCYLGKVRRDDISMHLQSVDKNMNDNEYRRAKFAVTAKRLKTFIKLNEKTLVYFPTIPLIENFLNYLEEHHEKLFKVTTKYYGRLDKEIKDENSAKFQKGEAKVMLATKAFGMGIDIPNIYNVYHFAPTGNVCDYVQEIGRAARDPQIDGSSYFDYLQKDFSHINSLHGMSTMRKEQLQMVAEKVLSIYKEKRKARNLLVNVEDFAHIFTDTRKVEDGDIEGKLKTALLLIEKDFTNRIGYSPFVARPRGIFSREYFRVTKKGEDILAYKKYAHFAKRVQGLNDGSIYTAVYELNLKTIWEQNYKNLSFPDFKRRFHIRDERIQLPFLTEINAVLIVNFVLAESLEYTKNSIFTKLDILSKFFSERSLKGRFFSIDDFSTFIVKHMKEKKYKAHNLAQVILQTMLRYTNLSQNSNVRSVLTFDEVRGYKVIASFDDFINLLKSLIESYLKQEYCEEPENGSYKMYVSKNQQDILEKLTIVFGTLEALGAVTYQAQGGSTPEIYIRINSTLQLESMIKNPANYQNKILNGVYDRHKLSNAMLTYIFKNQFDTKTFWDVIEDYFLGHVPESVLVNVKNIRVHE